MSSEDDAEFEAHAKMIGSELTKVRWRGIDDLELDTTSQPRVKTPKLEELAADYCCATAPSILGRRSQITELLLQGLAAYEVDGRLKDALFIHSLFFDGDESVGSPGASMLLKKAQKEYQVEMEILGRLGDEKRFFGHRSICFVDFSRFLIKWVGKVK